MNKEDNHEKEIDIKLKDIQLEQNKDLGYLSVETNAYLLNEKEIEKVGESTFVIYDESWGNVVEFADEKSANRLEMITSVCFKECEERYGFVPLDEPPYDFYRRFVYGRLAILDTFTIFHRFQNQGYGTEFMKELLSFLTHVLNVDFVLLQAYPYIKSFPHQGDLLTSTQRNENRDYINRYKKWLFHYYQKNFGFEGTGNPELNYMVLKTNTMKGSPNVKNVILDGNISIL